MVLPPGDTAQRRFAYPRSTRTLAPAMTQRPDVAVNLVPQCPCKLGSKPFLVARRPFTTFPRLPQVYAERMVCIQTV